MTLSPSWNSRLFSYPLFRFAAGGEGTKHRLKFGGQEEVFTVLGVHHCIGSLTLSDVSGHHQ